MASCRVRAVSRYRILVLVENLVVVRVVTMKKQIASLPLLLALLQLACSDSPTSPVSAASPQPAPARIEKSEPLPDPNFDASGPLIVENQVDVAAQRDGMLSNVLVDTG